MISDVDEISVLVFAGLLTHVIDFLDNDKGTLEDKEMIFGIVTRIDLLNFITLNNEKETAKNGDDELR